MAEDRTAATAKRQKTLAQELTDGHHSKRIPLRQKIAYGFGDFGNGFMFDLGQAYLTKFWIDAAGIGAGAVAGIFGFTKIFDAFMDPIAGSVIDNRKKIGKAGKFRPVMLISSFLLGIMTIVTFTMPDLSPTGKIIYAYVVYMIWGAIYSFTNDPYGSLASVMTRNVQDRSFLATSRQVGSVGAQFLTGIAFIPLMTMFGGNNERHGYLIAASIFAILGVVMFIICYLGTRENVKVHRDKGAQPEGFKDYFKVIFTNGPLFAIILMTIFTISAMNTNNQMMVFFAQYNLGHIGLQPIVNAIMMGTSIVGVFMIPTLTKHFGKRKTAMVSFIVGAAANILNFILPTNIATFIILVTIGYTALAIPNGITWAFVSDVIDYGEWHTGMRKEALTYAAFNFSRKLAQSLAALVSAGVLAITGYVANAHQTPRTLTGIKAAMTLYPGVCLLIAAVVVGFLYKLTDDRYTKIAADLDNGVWEKGKIGDKDIKK
ncbi:Na+ xyloside symporter related transporter [Agrilactobacillus composti DSM 18527 = JCM 14202]|uniref:Na+ xyloside symporter related transporter n=1 Tax=Agrilactobacillus composti DSM 18527 = JCM 14202 TaxID=1423734 RepID=X0QQ49_9LACO|nr:glycoside-pentoside-hexuronide (GPH):cation symporter [Agrilactobacillus composti]KRM33421.1 Na+ xyloside symporter related transporter [Agrilactobacillus composti DSM 18527 = JCM 14202]GAF40755.1 melibiose carrier protein, Na+/melibiose symporter [Agrilactobacillus composti DSM 18527 = JCM 14202]